jgi:hypothetical protein
LKEKEAARAAEERRKVLFENERLRKQREEQATAAAALVTQHKPHCTSTGTLVNKLVGAKPVPSKPATAVAISAKSPQSYDISSLHSGDEEGENEDEPEKPIPSWARGKALRDAIIGQFSVECDGSAIFDKVSEPNMDDIFQAKKKCARCLACCCFSPLWWHVALTWVVICRVWRRGSSASWAPSPSGSGDLRKLH